MAPNSGKMKQCIQYYTYFFIKQMCNKKWKSIVATPEAAGSLESILGPWTICYKRRCCPQDVQTYFKIMQQDETASELFWKLSNNPR